MSVSVTEQVALAQSATKKPQIQQKNQGKGLSSEMVMDHFQNGMKVFLATLKNQDPTNPMDAKDMAQYYAMTSQTSAMAEMKKRIENMSETISKGYSIQAASQLNNLVKMRSNTFSYNPQEPCEIGFFAPPSAQKASIVICDSKGEFVRIMDGDITPNEDGYHGIVWDGKDNGGESVRPGSYNFYVLAKDGSDNILRDAEERPIEIETSVFGRAMGSSYRDNQPQIMVSGKHYPMDDLISIQSGAIFDEYARVSQRNNQGSLAQTLQEEAQRSVSQALGDNESQGASDGASVDPLRQTQTLVDQLIQDTQVDSTSA